MKIITHALLNKETIFFRIAGILCIFFQITGYLLATYNHITWSIPNILLILFTSTVLGQLLGILIHWITSHITNRLSSKFSVYNSQELSLRTIFLLWLIIILCWLPGFLAYFPGVCSYDFSIQMGQAESGVFSDHHPFMHTLTIQFFWNLGRSIFSSGTIGIAMYTFFQMLILSGAFAYSLYILNKCRTHKWLLYGLTAFYGLLPVNFFMSISATKDTFFAAFVLVMTASLLYILRSVQTKDKCKGELAVFFMGTIGVIFFRNNGRYAVLAMMALILLLLIFDRKYLRQYLKIFVLTTTALLTAIMLLNTTQNAIHCTQGDRREMLSIPIQQWARIINKYETELNPETVTFIKQCIGEKGLYEYDPYISDPVKRHTNTKAILQNAGTFIRTYIQLFLEYPDEYINAILVQNSGFIYIFDTSHAWINYNPDIAGYGYIQTHELTDELAGRDIYKTSLIPKLYESLEDWTNNNTYLKLPVLNLLMAPGIWLSILLFVLATIFARKNYALLVPIGFILGYYLTLFLGPTVQLRYIYPVMLFLAFYLVWMMTNNFKRSTSI